MEAEILSALKERLNLLVPEILHIHIFNNQIEALKVKSEEGMQMYNIELPAVFIEYLSPMEIHQMGNGVQFYDPLLIKIHLAHNMINSLDGEMEQNLEVFDLKNKIYKALQKFEPNGCVAWVRTGEEQDYDHPNLYHFIMDFTTNYVDTKMMEPVNSKTTTAPITLQLDVDLDLVNDPNEDESAEN